MFFVVLCSGAPEGSTGIGSGFKVSQKTGQQTGRSWWYRTCDPGLQDIGLSPTPRRLLLTTCILTKY